jgi:hypothetical protein
MDALYQVEHWQQRWHGMKQVMQDWLAHYPSVSTAQATGGADYLAQTHTAQQTLASLLESLQAFGQSQLDFFADGLGPNPAYRLEPSLEYPWEYAFRVTVEQIGHDMDVLTRAFQQRNLSLGNDAARQTLAQADKLAYAALKPAIDNKLIDSDVTTITYFQKSVNVRLTPYAPVVLVGIPYSAITSKRDLLMIPHEVGHYVFREGRARAGRYSAVRLNAALYNRSMQPPAWLLPWLEEIFADVYGCLIGGPVMALSSQDLVLESSLNAFLADDGEHPVPLLRPAIYLAVLEAMVNYKRAARKLEKRWERLLAERGQPAIFQLQADGKSVSVKEAVDEMRAVVKMILQDYLHEVLDAKREVWSDDLGEGENAEQLTAKFEQKMALVEAAAPVAPSLTTAGTRGGDSELVMMRGEKQAHKRKLGNTELWFETIKSAARRAASSEGEAGMLSVPADVWLVLLTAGGWATEGPGMPNITS